MKFGQSYGETASEKNINISGNVHHDAYTLFDVTVKTDITAQGSTNIATDFNENYYKLKMALKDGQTNALDLDFWFDSISLYINGV